MAIMVKFDKVFGQKRIELDLCLIEKAKLLSLVNDK